MLAAGGIVLAGGRSARMGAPKAALEWHGSTLLRRTTGVLARAVDGPVLVMRAPGQDLPPLPAEAGVLDDPAPDLGPLQGIAAGLAAAEARGVSVAFVCATDLPLLHPAFVRRVLAAMQEPDEVVLPDVHGYQQPLAAAYRTALAPRLAELLAAGQRRLAPLFDGQLVVRRLDEAALLADPALAAADPALDSLLNVNTPADYAAARQRPAPNVTVDGHPVRAATLAMAATAAGRTLDERTAVRLNDVAVNADPELPLVAGDAVTLRP